MADGRTRIGWLHVSDLHVTKQKVGQIALRRPGSELWAEVQRGFFEDLDEQLETTGLEPDLVLITGDLAYSGEATQYEDLDRDFLSPLLQHLRARGADPVVFAVPGNHDVRRPSRKDARSYRLLRDYDVDDDQDDDLRGLREELWLARDAGFIAPLFPGYVGWMERTMLPALATRALPSGLTVEGLHRSHVPGDLSVVVARDGLRLLLVGLSSGWLQFDGGDFQGKLHVPLEQLHAALAPDEHAALRRFDDVDGALLLMHHPREWLSPAARRIFDGYVYPARDERWSACLFGHMHEARSEMVAGNGRAMRYFYQSPSLFGLEHYGESQERLDVGYTLGALYEDEEIRLWVRRLAKSGHFSVDPELRLESDGALVLRPARVRSRVSRPGLGEQSPMTGASAETGAARPSDAAMLGQWLLARHDRLELLAPMSTFSVPFDEVYIPLELAMQQAWQGRGGRRRGLEPSGTGAGRVIGLDEIFARARGDREAIVFGEAGSGKSTTLEKICHQMLVEGGEAVGLPRETLPLLLPLRLATRSCLLAEDPLLELARRVVARGEPSLAPEVVERLWARGGLLLLLDGLDEVADEQLRDELLEHIVRRAPARRSQGIRVVVSSRFSGVTPRAHETLDGSFLRLDVRPLERDRIEALVQSWFRAAKHWQAAPRTAGERARVEAEAREHAGRVIAELRRIETIDFEFKTLVASPLLLTLLCAVALANDQIPHERPEFYQRCLEVLLRRTTHKTGEPAPIPETDALRMLQVVAYRMHEERRRDGLSAAKLREWAWQEHERRRGRAEGPDPAALLRWLHEHAGVLTAHGEDDYGFSHLTYQEYLAALHVAYEGDAAIRGLADRFGDPWWQEVTLLCLAQRHRRTFETFMRHVLAGDRWLGDEVQGEPGSPETRRGARPPMELLRRCWEDASERSVAPFFSVLERSRAHGSWWRWVRGVLGQPADPGEDRRRRTRVLQLLLGETDPELLARAELLRDDEQEDAAVQALARELVDRAERARVADARPVMREQRGPAPELPKEERADEDESAIDEHGDIAADEIPEEVEEVEVERSLVEPSTSFENADDDADYDGFAEDSFDEARPIARDADLASGGGGHVALADEPAMPRSQGGRGVLANKSKKRTTAPAPEPKRSAASPATERRRSEPTRTLAHAVAAPPEPSAAPAFEPVPEPAPEPITAAMPAPPPMRPPADEAPLLAEEAKAASFEEDDRPAMPPEIPKGLEALLGANVRGKPAPAPKPRPASAPTPVGSSVPMAAPPPVHIVAGPSPSRAPAAVPGARADGPHEPPEWTEPTTGIRFLWVPGGTFTMGSTTDDPDARDEEQPPRTVTLTTGFWLAETPVTNAQYSAFLEASPDASEPTYWRDRRFSSREQPVVGIGWADALAFCRWLSTVAGRRIALPSEAQWERAARGDDGRRYPWGNEPPDEARACYGRERVPGRTNPVGSAPLGRGPYGHLDLAGNVWEWCQDTWADTRASIGPQTDPVIIDEVGDEHVCRGGGWSDEASRMRSACREGIEADVLDVDLGFRACCIP